MDDLKTLLKKREELIKKHPHLQEVQDTIDATMSSIEDPKARLNMIKHLMLESREQMADQLQVLHDKLQQLKRLLEQAQQNSDSCPDNVIPLRPKDDN